MPRFISHFSLLATLIIVALLSTSCGSLTTVRGDQHYYSETIGEKKPTRYKEHSDKNKEKKDKKKNKKNKKDKKRNDNTQPFRLPGDLDANTLALLEEAMSWLGTPYVWGGETKKGADCSGFVMMTYKNALGIKLPRTSYDQGKFCEDVDKKKLEAGDLVFFATSDTDRVSHVGIYVGDGKFIHASSSRGVMISDLGLKYFVDHYHHSGKVTQLHHMRKK